MLLCMAIMKQPNSRERKPERPIRHGRASHQLVTMAIGITLVHKQPDNVHTGGRLASRKHTSHRNDSKQLQLEHLLHKRESDIASCKRSHHLTGIWLDRLRESRNDQTLRLTEEAKYANLGKTSVVELDA